MKNLLFRENSRPRFPVCSPPQVLPPASSALDLRNVDLRAVDSSGETPSSGGAAASASKIQPASAGVWTRPAPIVGGLTCRLFEGLASRRLWIWALTSALILGEGLFAAGAARALSIDWKGHSRLEAYLQLGDTEEKGFIGHELVLRPRLSVLDDLILAGRIQLRSPDSETLFRRPPSKAGHAFRSFGIPLFYADKKSGARDLRFSPLLPEISHIYIDWKTELFQWIAGVAPRHFGLGATYNSREEDPFAHWISAVPQLSFWTEYGPLSVQPVLIEEDGAFLGLFQAGLHLNAWTIEAFYRYNIEIEEHYAEAFIKSAFGRQWSAALSFSYQGESEGRAHNTAGAGRAHNRAGAGRAQKQAAGAQAAATASPATETARTAGGEEGFALALELEKAFAFSFEPKFQLKAGGSLGGFEFHPAYNSAFLFQNYLAGPSSATSSGTGSSKTGPLNFNEGAASGDFAYIAPQAEFSFLKDKSLKIRPVITAAYDDDAEGKNGMFYEADLRLEYKPEASLIFSLTGGALFGKDWDFGLLTQAALVF